MRRNIAMVFTVIVSLFVGATISYIILNIYPVKTDTKIVKEISISETSINKSIEKIIEAVVVVESYRGNNLIASGSGFVYKKTEKDAYILTNNHVVEGATSINVTFSNDTMSSTTVVGKDKDSDIAVLLISHEKVIKVAKIGDSTKLKIGDVLFAVGAPSGSNFRGTVTKGIVSSSERFLNIKTTFTKNLIMKVIQTDAPVNPGNSGGPLVNINGEVIGITSLKSGGEEKVEGIAFAIPINDVLKYLVKLEKGETIQRPTIDLAVVSLTDSKTINSLGLTANREVTKGVMVTQVGTTLTIFKKGDIIIAIDNTEVNSSNYFNYLIGRYDVGEEISLRYYDGKAIKTTKVTVIKNK